MDNLLVSKTNFFCNQTINFWSNCNYVFWCAVNTTGICSLKICQSLKPIFLCNSTKLQQWARLNSQIYIQFLKQPRILWVKIFTVFLIGKYRIPILFATCCNLQVQLDICLYTFIRKNYQNLSALIAITWLFGRFPWAGECKGILRSSSQVTTCYHTLWMFYTVSI